MLQNRDRLPSRHPFKIVEKFIKTHSAFQILKQRIYWHAGLIKTKHPTHAIWILPHRYIWNGIAVLSHGRKLAGKRLAARQNTFPGRSDFRASAVS